MLALDSMNAEGSAVNLALRGAFTLHVLLEHVDDVVREVSVLLRGEQLERVAQVRRHADADECVQRTGSPLAVLRHRKPQDPQSRGGEHRIAERFELTLFNKSDSSSAVQRCLSLRRRAWGRRRFC